MTDTPRCFGIDLGTSTSAIGLVEEGRPFLIEIDGNTLVPSVVSFPGAGAAPLVGRPAVNSLQAMPERTIVSAKRKMGLGHVYSGIEHDGREVTPVDVAALVLEKLALGAERATGIRPQRVVITVPAWFTQAQRADTRRAGEQAGLEVVRIINEPTAAALAHAHGRELDRRALVYDLGGGTFDVSLVEQHGAVVEVKASHGDSELGGDDVDVLLRDRILDRLDRDDPALSEAIVASPGAMLRLRIELEKVKVVLGTELKARLSLPFLVHVEGQPRHLDLEITRDELDAVAGFIIQQTLNSVDQVLADTHLTPRDIDELILVGGSTKLRLVWKILHERYGLEGSHAIEPRDAVALGAAIQAAIVDGSRTDGMLLDVAPYSLSVGVADPRPASGRIHFVSQVITPRNAPLPARHTEVFYSPGTQRRFEIPVFQGSDKDPRRNTFLGHVTMEGLEPLDEDDEAHRAIQVEFVHDLDGLVTVRVTDETTGRTVTTKLAADGSEQTEQRERWLSTLVRNEVIFGDDEDDAAPTDSAADSDGLSSRAARADELNKARRTFDQTLAARALLEDECPDEAPKLLELAREGFAALQTGSHESALRTARAIEDLLFELGVYL